MCDNAASVQDAYLHVKYCSIEDAQNIMTEIFNGIMD